MSARLAGGEVLRLEVDTPPRVWRGRQANPANNVSSPLLGPTLRMVSSVSFLPTRLWPSASSSTSMKVRRSMMWSLEMDRGVQQGRRMLSRVQRFDLILTLMRVRRSMIWSLQR